MVFRKVFYRVRGPLYSSRQIIFNIEPKSYSIWIAESSIRDVLVMCCLSVLKEIASKVTISFFWCPSFPLHNTYNYWDMSRWDTALKYRTLNSWPPFFRYSKWHATLVSVVNIAHIFEYNYPSYFVRSSLKVTLYAGFFAIRRKLRIHF